MVTAPAAAAEVTKYIGEITSQLFDHHPALQGDLKLFVHEFEQKRHCQEEKEVAGVRHNLETVVLGGLDQVSEPIKEVENDLVPETKKLLNACDELLQLEAQFGRKGRELLEARRADRKQRMNSFMESMEEEMQAADVRWEKKRAELASEYTTLEKRLGVSSAHKT